MRLTVVTSKVVLKTIGTGNIFWMNKYIWYFSFVFLFAKVYTVRGRVKLESRTLIHNIFCIKPNVYKNLIKGVGLTRKARRLERARELSVSFCCFNSLRDVLAK